MPNRSRRPRSFDEVAAELKLRAPRLIGLRAVRLNKIVGSVGRARQVRADFRPENPAGDDRYKQILSVTRQGRPLPPISVYEVLGEYYVLDGHHRVAAAMEVGAQHIDADVIQFVPSAESPAKTLSNERARFELWTGLRDIELDEVGAYPRLLREIDEHKWLMSEDAGEDVGLKAAARDWYEKIYAPVAVRLLMRGAAKSFREKTLAAIYLHFESEKWLASEVAGRDVGLQAALDSFLAKYAKHGIGRELERLLGAVRADLLGAGRTLAEFIREELERRAAAPDLRDPAAAVTFQAEADQLSMTGAGLV